MSEENHNSERYVYLSVHCSTAYNSQDMEATWMRINKGVDKEDVAHRYTRTWLSHKGRTFAATWMDLETVILSEVSQAETNIMILLICGIFKKWYKWMYLQNGNSVTNTENKLMVPKEERGDWGWHIHTTTHKVDNKNLLYITGNST